MVYMLFVDQILRKVIHLRWGYLCLLKEIVQRLDWWASPMGSINIGIDFVSSQSLYSHFGGKVPVFGVLT
jgi:hypothetical protein